MAEIFEDSEYFTLKEAMELKNASEKEILAVIEKRKLRSIQVGGDLMIHRHDLDLVPQSDFPGLYYKINGEIIAP